MVRLEAWCSFALLVLSIGVARADDQALAQGIVGTWTGEHQHTVASDPRYWIKASTVDTYRDDGRVTGRSHYRYPDREESFEYEGVWRVEDGHLVIEVTAARGGFVKAGAVSRDKIMAVTATRLELQTIDGPKIILQRGADPR